MKIVYIAQSCDPYNGSEDQIGWSIPWESAKHNQVFVITRTDLKPSIERFLEQQEKRDITMFYVDIPALYKKVFKGPIYSGRLLKWNRQVFPLVQEICKRENVDIIHQITPVEFRSMGDYSGIPGVKYVCGPMAGGQWIDQPMLCYVKGKDRVVEWLRECVNRVFRAYLLADGRVKKCDWVLLANRETHRFLGAEMFGAHTSFFVDVGMDSSDILPQFCCGEKHPEVRFLVPARLVYLKGHDFLLDVLEQLPQELNYQCRIVGGGPRYAHLCRRCESPALRGKVQVVGAVKYTDMEREYRWADAVLFPSLREATGTVILEAMAKGVPVITVNRFGGAIILDENSGWFFGGNSVAEYQESLRCILEDCIRHPEKLEEKGKRALEAAAAYTWEEKVKHYQNIYSELLKNKGGHGEPEPSKLGGTLEQPRGRGGTRQGSLL